MNKHFFKISTLIFLSNLALPSYSQMDSLKINELGAVRLVGELKAEENINEISMKTMQDLNVLDVSEAVQKLSGINMAKVGDRNESVVYLRGFDLRQVPIFVDGVPVYVPFDGYVDLARFTTFDLSQIQVSKGGSSVIYGANTLGGAINLVSRKPDKKFEGDAYAGWLSGGMRGNLNVGGLYKKFYYQLGASYFERAYYPLSNNYKPNGLENGGRRDNAFNKDQKINLKIGFTPNKYMEHSVSFIYQTGEKGNPLYAGNDSLNPRLTKPRYWKWPVWNKSSIYYLSEIKLNSTQTLKTRLFYDQFSNTLESYDDQTFSSMKKGYAFISNYKDYSYGGNIEYGLSKIKNHQIKAALHYKSDIHNEDEGKPNTALKFQDFTSSIGIEDFYKFNEKWSMVSGISYNIRQSVRADKFVAKTTEIEQFASNKNAAMNADLNLNFKPNKNNDYFLKLARKTRFATIKDRYSYRLGTALPNPALTAENAINAEVGGNLKIGNKTTIQSSLFYSGLSDAIQNVNNAYSDSARKGLSQQQNTGRAQFYGFELNFSYKIKKNLLLNGNYSFIKRENLSNSTILFTNVPQHSAFVNLQYFIKDKHWLMVNNTYNSARYSTSYGTKAAAYSVTNLKTHIEFSKFGAFEFGVNNIIDNNYQIAEGFPEAGRNYFVGVRGKF